MTGFRLGVMSAVRIDAAAAAAAAQTRIPSERQSSVSAAMSLGPPLKAQDGRI
jgi:hypothetical protein